LPDGKQHAEVGEARNAMARGDTTPARIAAIAKLANSCLIELRDLTLVALDVLPSEAFPSY
jgi:hypothetical protein